MIMPLTSQRDPSHTAWYTLVMPFAEQTELIVKRITASNWELQSPLVYGGKEQIFVINKGFITDFASVPQFATWLVPKYGVYTLAVILHDYLCSEGIRTQQVTSPDADGILRRVMREEGVSFPIRWLVWTAVRYGALVDPLRRPGSLSTLPLVSLVSIVSLPFLIVPMLGVLIGLGFLKFAEVLSRWASAK